eukprot:GHVU01089662.1.p1 GENE.GHVU01089662.1~~GHVU01089662.1.p1  ORF type:complete len:146 (+),score=2.83 GHVU01089662.1:450-887(+)
MFRIRSARVDNQWQLAVLVDIQGHLAAVHRDRGTGRPLFLCLNQSTRAGKKSNQRGGKKQRQKSRHKLGSPCHLIRLNNLIVKILSPLLSPLLSPGFGYNPMSAAPDESSNIVQQQAFNTNQLCCNFQHCLNDLFFSRSFLNRHV